MRELRAALVILWLALASAVHGASIEAEVRPLTQRPRSDAPSWVEIELISTTAGLREGVLEIEMLESGRSQFVLRTHELAFVGKHKQRMLLPGTTSIGGERELSLHFLEKGERRSLGLKPLGALGWGGQSFVIAIGKGILRTGGDGQPLWVSLKLENLTRSYGSEGLTTSPVYLEPEDFPVDPLGYCAFDIVMIDGAVFSQLREKSLTALGAWLAAGGSVLVTAREKLTLGHARTLAEWAARDPHAEMLRFDSEGLVDAGKDGIAHFRAGLGRLVVTTKVPDEKEAAEATGLSLRQQSEAPPMRWTGTFEVKEPGEYSFSAGSTGPSIKVLADGKPFLSAQKGRAGASGTFHLDAGTHHFEIEMARVYTPPNAQAPFPFLMQRGPLPTEKRNEAIRFLKVEQNPGSPAGGNKHPWLAAAIFLWKIDREPGLWATEYQRAVELSPERFQMNPAGFHNDLFQAMMPDQVQTIPIILLFGILVVFVAAVGPLDWWLLGRLRARRWTWLLFPAVAGATTVLTVLAARFFMGSATISRSLVITDLAADRQVVRETRCDILLPSHSGEREAAFSRVLAAPMPAGSYSRRNDEEEDDNGMIFEGQFPANYKLRRGFKQWKPMVTQSTSIGPGEDRSGIKWHEFRLAPPSESREIGRKMSEGTSCGVGYATIKDVFEFNDKTLPRDALEWIISPRGRARQSAGISHSPGSTRSWLELMELGNDEVSGPTVVFAWRMESFELHVWRWLYRP